MSDVILIHESSYARGMYYRVDFVRDSILRSGLSYRLYACGPVLNHEDHVVGWEIGDSRILRLVNFIGHMVTLRSFPHLGFLIRMWPSLTVEKPAVVTFYSHWTGLFLLLWRKLTRVRTKLVWEWYDLATRMRYYGRKPGLFGKIMTRLEERTAPRHFDGLVVPTRFAQHLIESWGHPKSRIHVLGEVRKVNPYVSKETLERRIEEVNGDGALQIAWVGFIRHYQLVGLTRFLEALTNARRSNLDIVVHVVGPPKLTATGVTWEPEMSTGIEVRLHGFLSSDALDRLLAQSHLAIHPLPDELFAGYIYSRKLADYLAAALPVAFSAVEGLTEIAQRFGVGFDLGNPASVVDALTHLSTPEHYQNYLLQASRTAEAEFSTQELERKGRELVSFLAEIRDNVTASARAHQLGQ